LRLLIFQLTKRSESSDTEVQMISNLFSFVHSAMSIMSTFSVEEENKNVEAAFKTLVGIATGKVTKEDCDTVESMDTFNRLCDRLDSLLVETIKTSKNQK
ncbi:hypothetical protein PMAYCL1PPCAC_17357, partial [Pristionchus mayeri]